MKDNNKNIKTMTENNVVQKILLPDNYVKLDKNLVRYLGLELAAITSMIIEFDSYISKEKKHIIKDGKNWIYISLDEALKRYRLTADRFQKLSNDLSKTGVVETRIFGLPRRKHFHIDYHKVLEIMNMKEEEIDLFHCRDITDNVVGQSPTIISEESRQPLYIDVSNKEKNKDNISSHSSDKNEVLEEKQTSIVFENVSDKIEDANCTLPSQDIRKPRKTKKNEITEEELAIKAEKSQYTKEFKRLWYEKGKPKLEMEGYNAISKLYDKYGLDKANHIRDYILAMYGSNQLSIPKHKNHDDALMSYQDPNQETPKYLSNEAYKRQSHYKGGNVPDEKMIPSEATFYASLEWHFSDRYEGAELVKKVREFIQENNCKFKNY